MSIAIILTSVRGIDTIDMVAESQYILQDPGNRHGVDVAQSLERSRQTKLFAGKTFYVAGKSLASMVPLLKTVVAAGGGQVRISLNRLSLQTPDACSRS